MNEQEQAGAELGPSSAGLVSLTQLLDEDYQELARTELMLKSQTALNSLYGFI